MKNRIEKTYACYCGFDSFLKFKDVSDELDFKECDLFWYFIMKHVNISRIVQLSELIFSKRHRTSELQVL